MYEVRIGFVWSTTDSDQCGTWLLGAKRTAIIRTLIFQDQGPYEFAVSGAGEDYIDLLTTYLFVEAHIVNTGGSNLKPDTDVGPVDLWMHSLFSDVSVSLNEKLISPCGTRTLRDRRTRERRITRDLRQGKN